jgi:hypothetical protein
MRFVQQRVRAVTALAVTIILASAIAAVASSGWTSVSGALAQPVRNSAAVELADGRVLVIGGDEPQGMVSTTTIFDPQTNTWSATGSLRVPTSHMAATRLLDGRVLVSGGNISSPFSGVEIYDPATGEWTLTGFMPYSAQSHSAVTLSDGRVFTAGGLSDEFLATEKSALFNPADNAWVLGPPMTFPRVGNELVALADGRILAIGGVHRVFEQSGSSFVPVLDAEIFDPVSNTWSPGGRMAVAHVNFHSGRLPDGRVIVAGGDEFYDAASPTAAEVFHPATGEWQLLPPMLAPHLNGVSAAMADGTFIVAGGQTQRLPEAGTAFVEAFNPRLNAWTALAPMSTGRTTAALATFDGGRRMLVVGGAGAPFERLDTGEVYRVNLAPSATASVAQPVLQAIPGSPAAAGVSAAGSSDPDDDLLTYTWTRGATLLARTTGATTTASLPLDVGVHAITLTVTDTEGAAATAAVSITVQDGVAGLQAQNAQLAAQLMALGEELERSQLRLQVCKGAISAADAAIEVAMRLRFRDPQFRIPGSTPELKLGAFVVGTLATSQSCQQQIYRNLGGRK